MKNILIILLVSSVAAFSQELKVFNKTIIYEDGSWVNPDEPKFEVKNPKTWAKRNYVRHYMQGSQEITDSIIEVNWKDFTEAAKTGNKIQLKDFIKVFRFKKTVSAVKDHPEAAIVPVGMAGGSAAERDGNGNRWPFEERWRNNIEAFEVRGEACHKEA